MNKYTITNINASGLVSLNMFYGDYSKSVDIVADISSPDTVTMACEDAYAQFKNDIDNQPVLSDDVLDLIGTQKTDKQVLTSMQSRSIKEIVQEEQLNG